MTELLFVNPVTSWLFRDGVELARWLLVVGAAASYVFLRPGKAMRFAAACLLAGGLLFRGFVAAYQTAGQYFIFADVFLPPYQPISYFVGYAFSRYWLGLLLAALCAAAWFAFLHALRRRADRFFDEGEIVLAALLVFAVGWPGIVVLFPAAAAALVLLSLYRSAVLKQPLTTLGVPFLVAATLTLMFQREVLGLLGLELF